MVGAHDGCDRSRRGANLSPSPARAVSGRARIGFRLRIGMNDARSSVPDVTSVEVDNGIHDLVGRGGGESGMDREGETVGGSAFGGGKGPGAIAEIREARLEVERRRIVDLGS